MFYRVQQCCTVILVVFVLSACSSGHGREEAAKQRFQSIPLIVGSTQVVAMGGISGGSSKTCWGGYVEALYGSYKPKKEVINLYRQYAYGSHWVLINTDFSAGVHFRDDTEDAYVFSITFMKSRGPFELHPSAIDQKVIDEALGKFNTVYALEISYYPGWKDC